MVHGNKGGEEVKVKFFQLIKGKLLAGNFWNSFCVHRSTFKSTVITKSAIPNARMKFFTSQLISLKLIACHALSF